MTGTRPTIRISGHAIERARLRHPEFLRERGVAGMYAEVCQALADGRRAKTQPRWAARDGRRRKAEKRFGRGVFVWNEEETRCYALRAATAPNAGRCWIVATMMSNEHGDDEEVA